jgi:hypothetical protein
VSLERSDLVERLEGLLTEWIYFHEVLSALADASYRTVLGAWSDVRERHDLERDEQGRYRRV